ncbi:MAG: MBL fold metallo-hydrolase, partial [Massilibacteroides sp.]|nr:MBL fold metallo-hydrolase [Massilibacteroides sp.]
MQITYIYHSGYLLEAETCNVIFDFYKDSGNKPGEGIIHQRILDNPKPLYIFASHFHPDHFNPEILKWKQQRDNSLYIFSKDILEHQKATSGDAIYLEKGQTYNDDRLQVKAFGSTDVGVSFLLELEEKRIFHAGDLNNWHW